MTASQFPSKVEKIDGTTYSTENFIFRTTDKGVLREVLFRGRAIINALAVESIDDVERRFGKPDKASTVGWLVVNEWYGRKLRVSFDKRSSKIESLVVYR